VVEIESRVDRDSDDADPRLDLGCSDSPPLTPAPAMARAIAAGGDANAAAQAGVIIDKAAYIDHI